jgi:hypothetical protein
VRLNSINQPISSSWEAISYINLSCCGYLPPWYGAQKSSICGGRGGDGIAGGATMPIGRSDDEMPCHAAAAAANDAGEGVASGLGWYCDCETWYCHICCCCCCCGVGMSGCSCFIIIAEEVAAGRPARGPYPGLHTYCGICESTQRRDKTRSVRRQPQRNAVDIVRF